MTRPLIGITGRRQSAAVIAHMDKRFGARHADVFFADYARCLAAANATPVELPFEAVRTDVLEHLDGLVVTGGQDVHPGLWNGKGDTEPPEDPRLHYNVSDPERDDYEAELVRGAIAKALPVLGVCRGIQLINAALGGTLVADIAPSGVTHLQPESAPADGAAEHVVEFAEGSLAHRLYGRQRLTNAWHHQAVDVPAPDIVVTGRAADGTAEAIEHSAGKLLGLQWHPEWQSEPDPAFDWLIARAQEGRR